MTREEPDYGEAYGELIDVLDKTGIRFEEIQLLTAALAGVPVGKRFSLIVQCDGEDTCRQSIELEQLDLA